MQTLGIGVDIIENSRIKKSIINKNFINRVFSLEEIIESKKDSSVEKIKYVMENTHLEFKNFQVPLIVDYGIGDTWGESH